VNDFDINHYLVLSERKNSLDSLERSLEFLQKAQSQNNYWKWFILAFHHALHSLLIISLPDKDRWRGAVPRTLEEFDEAKLKDFNPAYQVLLRNKMGDNKELAELLCDSKPNAKHLNDKLRNVLQHFKREVWAYDRSIIAEVCLPLVNLQEELWKPVGDRGEIDKSKEICGGLKKILNTCLS